MMTLIEGTYCPRLKCLKAVLGKWVSLNHDMFVRWRPDQDVPWWHTERASLSTLSAAIWLSGGMAIEEYTDLKHRVSRRTGQASVTYPGYVDLYFEIAGRKFRCEAKFCDLAVSQSLQDQWEEMTSSLNEAEDDIRKSDAGGRKRLAVLFITPQVHRSRLRSLRESIDGTVRQVRRLDGDAFAWVFPGIESCISEEDLSYPGTALVIREVK